MLGFVHVSTTFESIDLMLPLDGTVAMLVRVQQARSLAIGRIAAAAWEAAQCSFVLKEQKTNTKCRSGLLLTSALEPTHPSCP